MTSRRWSSWTVMGLLACACALPRYETGAAPEEGLGGTDSSGGETIGQAGGDLVPSTGGDESGSAPPVGGSGTGGAYTGGVGGGGTPSGGAPTGGAAVGGDEPEGGSVVGGSSSGGDAVGGATEGGETTGGGTATGSTATGGTGGTLRDPPHRFTFDEDEQGWAVLNAEVAPSGVTTGWVDDGSDNGVLVVRSTGLTVGDSANLGITGLGLAGAASVTLRLQLRGGAGAELAVFVQDQVGSFWGGRQPLATLPVGEWLELSIGLPADSYQADPDWSQLGVSLQATDAEAADAIELWVDDYVVSTTPSASTGHRLLEACEDGAFCAPFAGAAEATLIDPVDDTNEIEPLGDRHGWWFLYGDPSGSWTAGVDAESNTPLPVEDPLASGGFGYVVTRTASTDWGGGIGLTFSSQSPDTGTTWLTCPYDAADYAGVRFRARGAGPARFRVPSAFTSSCTPGNAGLCAAACGDDFGADLELEADWAEFTFTWEELHPEGWGTPVGAVLDLTTLHGFNWQTKPASGDVVLGVDQVEFLPRQGWSFRSGLEGFELDPFEDPGNLGATTELLHDATAGSPGAGSVRLEIPFSGPEERVSLQFAAADPLDLTGRTLTARVRVDTWNGSSTTAWPGALLFVISGDDFCWAAHGWTNLTEAPDWIELRFPLADADFGECAGAALTDVRRVGVQINSGQTDPDGPAVIHVDSLFIE